MEVVLDDNGLLEYIKIYVAKPLACDAQDLSQWKEDLAKSRRIVLEGVQDYIVSNLHRKEIRFMMWKSLT